LFFDALNGPSWFFLPVGDPNGVVDCISAVAEAKLGFEMEMAFKDLESDAISGLDGDGIWVVDIDFWCMGGRSGEASFA
jgi:hypothetical protein